MFALYLYLCHHESYYIMLYKVYMVRDMFYNNLCHFFIWSAESGNDYLCVTTCPSLSLTPLAAFVFVSTPFLAHTLREPPSVAQPPYSSMLNATTQGAFLQSLFSLSSQCRFAVSRGVVVERRKQEEINREGQKAGRQTRDRAGELSKVFSTSDKWSFKYVKLINSFYLKSA